MNADEGIVARLKDDTATRGYVGVNVFPDFCPEKNENNEQVTVPYIVVQATGGEPDMYLDGPGQKSQCTWEVTVYDADPDRCATVAAFARASLNGFSGISAGSLFEGMYCDVITSQTEEDNSAPDVYWRVRRFNVYAWWSEILDPLSYPSDAASSM